MTSNFFTGPPPKTIAHTVRLELHPSEQQQQSATYTYTIPAFPHVCYSDRSGWPGRQNQSCSPRSFSWTSQASQSVTSSASSLELFVKNFEHCMPDITLGRGGVPHPCFRAGSYQCTATGRVFVMDGQGDVHYIVVTWDMDLLASWPPICKETYFTAFISINYDEFWPHQYNVSAHSWTEVA